MFDNNVENHDERLEQGMSPETWNEPWNAVERKWKEDLFKSLRRGSEYVEDLACEAKIELELETERGTLKVTAAIKEAQVEHWIEDLEKQGCLTRDDKNVLTGLGPYAKVPLTQTENEVLFALNHHRTWIVTLMGVKKRMKTKEVDTDEVKEILDDLVNRGYVKHVEGLGGRPSGYASLV